MATCEEVLQERLGPLDEQAVRAQLWYATGVRVDELDSRALISRWGLRGIEVRGERPPSPDSPEPLWEGPAGVTPPTHVSALFAADMCWLALIGTDS